MCWSKRQAGRLAVVALFILTALAGDIVAADRRVKVHNQTGSTMIRLHASNAGTDSWQEDILGDNMIDSGFYWRINFDDGTGYCIFDFKGVFTDGERYKYGVNVCQITDFY